MGIEEPTKEPTIDELKSRVAEAEVSAKEKEKIADETRAAMQTGQASVDALDLAYGSHCRAVRALEDAKKTLKEAA
ncbi:hypothetical protein HQ571_05405 [Candidatus Kuenenbacteria bacterium]|nr:hypothetical protein [Candidatus Kuenenbacteria bacterium]